MLSSFRPHPRLRTPSAELAWVTTFCWDSYIQPIQEHARPEGKLRLCLRPALHFCSLPGWLAHLSDCWELITTTRTSAKMVGYKVTNVITPSRGELGQAALSQVRLLLGRLPFCSFPQRTAADTAIERSKHPCRPCFDARIRDMRPSKLDT